MIGSGKIEKNTYYKSRFLDRICKILWLNIATEGGEKTKDETNNFLFG